MNTHTYLQRKGNEMFVKSVSLATLGAFVFAASLIATPATVSADEGIASLN